MEADLNNLKKGQLQVDKELVNLPEDSRDPFKHVMQAFNDTAITSLDGITKSFQKLQAKYKSTLEYFGEDPNQDSDVFLGTLYKFISNLEVFYTLCH